ncbi:MAG: ATP-binding protein [Calditrichaeota bacterium]|nr:ATP-binding protein [Calditrichota bacterium]
MGSEMSEGNVGEQRGDEVVLTIPSDPRMLKIVRAGVGHLCAIMGFANVEKNSVVLAVDEACSNIIKHAYGGENGHPIEIRCRMFPDRLEVHLRDYGKKADLQRLQAPATDRVRPGGFGLHLIRTVMDTVEYSNDPVQGNHLLLVKLKRDIEERSGGSKS